jgi:hypothetical protein
MGRTIDPVGLAHSYYAANLTIRRVGGDPVIAQVSREFPTPLSQRFGAQCAPSSDFTAWIMLTITFCASP